MEPVDKHTIFMKRFFFYAERNLHDDEQSIPKKKKKPK